MMRSRRNRVRRVVAVTAWCLIASAPLVSTALVLKKWLRSPRLMQLWLITAMVMIAVIAVLTTLYKARYDWNAMMPQWPFSRHVWEIPMYLKIPLSMGIGCVVFVVITSGVAGLTHGSTGIPHGLRQS